MNRRDMVFEMCLALFAVTAIVVGNFLVQRWWTSGQTARVADATTEPNASPIAPESVRPDDLDDFIPPRPVSDQSSAAKSARNRQRLQALIAEQLPDASDDEREAWLKQLDDLPFEAAVGILETRRQVGALSDSAASPSSNSPSAIRR